MTAPARSDNTATGTSTKDRAAAKPGAAKTSTAAKASTTVEQPERLAPAERPRRTRSAAAERAYARRAQREGRRDGTARVRTEARTRPSVEARSEPRSEARPRRQPVVRKQASTATFVVLVISLLLVGVATTLWLSTQAIADSYRLDEAKKGVAALSEQAELLRRDVTSMDSASALAKRAQELGMVPSGDPAYLVVGPNGKVKVVGDPKPVEAPKPPPSSTTANPPANNSTDAHHGEDHG